MLAAGSYSGAAALVDPRTRELLCLLEGGHSGGITHVRLRLCPYAACLPQLCMGAWWNPGTQRGNSTALLLAGRGLPCEQLLE